MKLPLDVQMMVAILCVAVFVMISCVLKTLWPRKMVYCKSCGCVLDTALRCDSGVMHCPYCFKTRRIVHR